MNRLASTMPFAFLISWLQSAVDVLRVVFFVGIVLRNFRIIDAEIIGRNVGVCVFVCVLSKRRVCNFVAGDFHEKLLVLQIQTFRYDGLGWIQISGSNIDYD